MKKILICFIAIFLLTAAYSKSGAVPSLDQIPDSYSLEDAKSDHCVVFESSVITSGTSEWKHFLKATYAGRDATVRLAYYYTLGDPSQYSEEYYNKVKDDYPLLFIKNLKFDGEKYLIEGYEDGQYISKEYRYLVKYEGAPSSSTALFNRYTYYVLVNDNTITWDDIERGMLSSQSGDLIDHYLVYSDLDYKETFTDVMDESIEIHLPQQLLEEARN